MKLVGDLELDGNFINKINNVIQSEVSNVVKSYKIKSRVENEITSRVKIQVDRMYREGKFTDIIKRLSLDQITDNLDISDQKLIEYTDLDLDKLRSEIVNRVMDKIANQIFEELMSSDNFKDSIRSQVLKNIGK